MELSAYNLLIDQFCESISLRLDKRSNEGGSDTWPAPLCGPVEGHYVKFEYFWTEWKKLLSTSSIETIAQKIKHPTRLARILYLTPGLKEFWDWSLSERIYLTGELIRCISILRPDIFCKSGQSILLTDEQVDVLVENHRDFLINVSDDVAARSVIGRICALLFIWCEQTFLTDHGLAHEFHGPYNTHDGKVLMIREYHNLRPWFFNFAQDHMRFDKIEIQTYFHNDPGFVFDFMGALSNNKSSNWLDSLSHLSIKYYFDGSWQYVESQDELVALFAEIDSAVAEIINLTKNYSRCDFMIQYTNIGFDLLRTFIEGKDFDSLREQACDKTINVHCIEAPGNPFKKLRRLENEARLLWINNYFDPRNNISHSSLIKSVND